MVQPSLTSSRCLFSRGTFYPVLKGHQKGEHQKSAGSQDKDRDRLVGGGHHLKAKNLTGTDELLNDTDSSETHGKAKSHAQSVKKGGNYRIFRSVGLCSAQDDAVYDDQRDIDTERIVKVRQIRLRRN